jgi:hypothetical protein
MTDYNDGNWRGWNGGECPVHPKSLVDYVWHDPRTERAGVNFRREAIEEDCPRLAWGNVVKFRVVKEFREPRECWSVGEHIHYTEAEAIVFRKRVADNNPGVCSEDRPIIHWREVAK